MKKQDHKELSIQVSSNLTLPVKLGLSVFWAAYFGIFTLTVLLSEMPRAFNLSPLAFKALAVLFYLVGLWVLYKTIWQLKRVEFMPDGFYVTDYFRHYKLGYGLIRSVKYYDFIVFKVMVLLLSQKTSVGRRIPLLVSRKRLRIFLNAHPDLSKQVDFSHVIAR